MMKLKIRDHEIRLVRLNQAKLSDVIRLQEESGLKLVQLRDLARKSDVMAVLVASYLSQHNAGMRPKWDELLDAPMDSFKDVVGEPIPEAGDVARQQEAEGEQSPDPQVLDSATLDGETGTVDAS